MELPRTTGSMVHSQPCDRRMSKLWRRGPALTAFLRGGEGSGDPAPPPQGGIYIMMCKALPYPSTLAGAQPEVGNQMPERSTDRRPTCLPSCEANIDWPAVESLIREK